MIFLHRKKLSTKPPATVRAKAPVKRRRFPPIVFEAAMVVVALAVILSAASYLKLDWQNLFFGELKQVQLVGEYKRVDRFDLEAVFQPVIGQHLMQIDLTQLEQQLQTIPWVKRTTISRVWPDQLTVHIEERQAVARWKEHGLIDQHGEVFFPEDIEYPELPLFVTDIDNNAETLGFYYYVSEEFRPLQTRITHLIKHAPRSWKIALQEGFVITLGQQDIQYRLQRFVKSYRQGLGDIKEHIQCIDLRYPDGFSVLWKKQKGQSLC